MQELTITQPDDWHIHLRDGAYLSRTVADVAARYGRAIIMPNLAPPITTITEAKAYLERIVNNVPEHSTFTPLMTLYLTDKLTADTVKQAKTSGIITAIKLYPAGVTTNSDAGIADLSKLAPVLEEMEKQNLPLLVHGEVNSAEVDIFDREAVFIEQQLEPIASNYPNLRIVLEHITTKQAVEFVRHANHNVAATITAHHLLLNRNHMLTGGIKPHYYCLPILKRKQHQQALLEAAISGNPKFFLGTDSAPHSKDNKESACGCAGVYSGNASIELYAEIFDKAGALNKLENFASHFGADFYQLPYNQTKLKLIKQTQVIPEDLSFGDSIVIPFRAGESVAWSIA